MTLRRLAESFSPSSFAASVCSWALLASVAASAATFQDDVDYTKLKSRLGAATPTGAGGAISQVEPGTGGASGPYFIDTTSTEFTDLLDPTGTALTVIDGSGNAAAGVSGHATNVVAVPYYGNTGSTAPGANNVTLYEANNWLANVLKYNLAQTPLDQQFRVQNHSWIGTTGSAPQDQSILRRFDYLIEKDEMTGVVGTNNNEPLGNPTVPNPSLAHPNLLVHSYNAIVAGRTDGRHARGATNSVYGTGRFRPDLVAPAASSSTAAARISSAAAMLHESVAGTDAARSETMKAILLAGATKNEFDSYIEPATTLANPWDRTPTRPLDDVFGAGELNIYNSYLIGIGGKQSASAVAPTATVGSYGWDYQNRKADGAVGDLYYNFQVAEGSTAQELSIILAWNAKITDTNPSPGVFAPVESLQNLDLQLYDSTNSFMGALLDQSVSTVDNVEHIYLTDLGPGTYTLKVSGAANWDYGLAWRMATAFDQPSADFDGDGFVSGNDFLIWQRNFGKLLGASRNEGDADGDGDVDGDDLELFKTGIIAPPPPAMASFVAAIPEPSSALLAAAAMMGMRLARLRRRRGTMEQ